MVEPKMVYRVGDWVRFTQEDRLVIAVVEYIEPSAYDGIGSMLVTDYGKVSSDAILEVRPFETTVIIERLRKEYKLK